jgi:hypothetical protein
MLVRVRLETEGHTGTRSATQTVRRHKIEQRLPVEVLDQLVREY